MQRHRRDFSTDGRLLFLCLIAAIIGGLIAAGLRLDFLHEHEVLPYRLYPSMVPDGQLFRLPDGSVPFPLAFSLRATKP